MAALKDIHKRWIVEQLAVFDSPSEVAQAFKEEYGITIARQQVNNYDASKTGSRNRMARALVELFDKTREAFLSSTEGIAIANKSYRLLRLDRIARKAAKMKNYRLERETLEQAAREMGGAYTNRRELTGKGGSPIETQGKVVIVMPDNGRGDHDTKQG